MSCGILNGCIVPDWTRLAMLLQVCTFLNTFQLLNDSNRLAVLASCNTGVACLFSDLTLLLDPEAVVPRGAAADAVVEELTSIVEGEPPLACQHSITMLPPHSLALLQAFISFHLFPRVHDVFHQVYSAL